MNWIYWCWNTAASQDYCNPSFLKCVPFFPAQHFLCRWERLLAAQLVCPYARKAAQVLPDAGPWHCPSAGAAGLPVHAHCTGLDFSVCRKSSAVSWSIRIELCMYLRIFCIYKHTLLTGDQKIWIFPWYWKWHGIHSLASFWLFFFWCHICFFIPWFCSSEIVSWPPQKSNRTNVSFFLFRIP